MHGKKYNKYFSQKRPVKQNKTTFMKKLIIFIVKLLGWEFNLPNLERPELKRSVYIMAPHTSFWDFFLGASCIWHMGVPARFFMKKEFFNFITTPFLNAWGVIPVDRGNTKNNLVGQAVEHFNSEKEFVMIVTPEGTRKAVKRWKRGFYEIASQANVPIILTYIDYKYRRMGIGPTFYPTGDFQSDIQEIMKFYQDKNARHPEGFNPQANQ